MEHRWKFLLSLAIAVLFSLKTTASARQPENVYQAIARRNAFALVPVEMETPQLPPEVLPRISYTGFTTILGDKRIVLRIQAFASGQSAGERSVVLSEGESKHAIKVLCVDERGEWALISRPGKEMRLSLER